MLAGFPLLQLLRLVPGFAAAVLPDWDSYAPLFDLLLMAWVFALAARSVAIALAPARPGRWWRALAGGLVLIAPLWFAPSIAPNEPWWKEPSAQEAVDPRYPNPASEPVLVAQRRLLDDALADLDDERPSVTDLYFVGFAGDAHEDVFRKDVLAAQKVMDERWGTDGRSLALINNPRTLLETPIATVTQPARGAERDRRGDRHRAGRRDGLPREPRRRAATCSKSRCRRSSSRRSRAPALRELLDDAGIKWRIIVVSACYSGGFVDALEDDNTLVLTARQADRAAFGCGHRDDATTFGEALFQHGLAQSESLPGRRSRPRASASRRAAEEGGGPCRRRTRRPTSARRWRTS